MQSLGAPDQEEREDLAAHSRGDADKCCVCETCGKVELGCGFQCSACGSSVVMLDAQEAEEAAQEVEYARRRLDYVRGDRPVATILLGNGPTVAQWVAFPGPLEAIPSDAYGDAWEVIDYWTSDAAAFVGRGDSPQAALDDLIRIATENPPVEPSK